MTRPSIHSRGHFVYKHVDIYFLAGGQATAVEWTESGNLPVWSPLEGMTTPSIHWTGNFVYKHVDIYFLAGGQVRAVEWMENSNLPVWSPLRGPAWLLTPISRAGDWRFGEAFRTPSIYIIYAYNHVYIYWWADRQGKAVTWTWKGIGVGLAWADHTLGSW